MFEPVGWEMDARLLVQFAHYALQKGLVAFAMAAKEPDLPGRDDARDIVTLLEQEVSLLVDDDCECNFAVSLRHERGLLSSRPSNAR
jgi:hypothetical protein